MTLPLMVQRLVQASGVCAGEFSMPLQTLPHIMQYFTA